MPDVEPPNELLSVRAYARHRGVDEKAVRVAIRTGRLVRSVVRESEGAPAKIAAVVADEEWRRSTHPGQSRAEGGATDPARPDDYRRVLIVEKLAKAQLAQLQLDRARGELVPTEDVRNAQARIATMVRDHLLQLPDRIAPIVAAEPDERRVREILLEEIRAVLFELAGAFRAIAASAQAG